NLGFRLVFIPPDSSPKEPEPFVQREPVKTESAKTEVRISGPTHTNSIGMEFVRIPPGSFMMGFNGSEFDSEKPEHKVVISKSFYLGKHEVTHAQWAAVMGDNPSEYECQSCPVDTVSWHDAQKFITRLNTKEGHSRYRLPTEAEWEYAARAGTRGPYFFGNDLEELSGYAWYNKNSDKPRPVGQKLPNPWGLHDMYGNVWEWVQDFYSDTYYANSPRYDPEGPSDGSEHTLRGGAFWCEPSLCNSMIRFNTMGLFSSGIGFRLAISVE
ncbi:formylglycine-generating enzyme family protein, partial [Desulfovibrio sp. OttesenSCG-928-I05]|nr:formylglycine-generating enzyme family protein [Desulfovibrio sp. OttesenSCG-928-I05]